MCIRTRIRIRLRICDVLACISTTPRHPHNACLLDQIIINRYLYLRFIFHQAHMRPGRCSTHICRNLARICKHTGISLQHTGISLQTHFNLTTTHYNFAMNTLESRYTTQGYLFPYRPYWTHLGRRSTLPFPRPLPSSPSPPPQLFGALKWHSRSHFRAPKSLNFQGPPLTMARVMHLPAPKTLHTGQFKS